MLQPRVGQEVLIQEGEGADMTQEEFESLQAALVASMNQDNEEIIIGDDEDGAENSNTGYMQQMMGMLGFAAQNPPDENEDESKD